MEVSPCPPPRAFIIVICYDTLCWCHERDAPTPATTSVQLTLEGLLEFKIKRANHLDCRPTWWEPHWPDGAPNWPTTSSRNIWRGMAKTEYFIRKMRRQDSGRDSHASNNLKIPSRILLSTSQSPLLELIIMRNHLIWSLNACSTNTIVSSASASLSSLAQLTISSLIEQHLLATKWRGFEGPSLTSFDFRMTKGKESLPRRSYAMSLVNPGLRKKFSAFGI